jgi:hypothetical protein
MKYLILTLAFLVSAPAFACKMTRLGFDAYRIQEATTFFMANTAAAPSSRLLKVRINEDDQAVVEYSEGGVCRTSTFAISPQADCKPLISEIKTNQACE